MQTVGEASYNSWLRPLRPVALHDDQVVLLAPLGFLRDWISNNYRTLLEREFRVDIPHLREVVIDVGMDARLEAMVSRKDVIADDGATLAKLAHGTANRYLGFDGASAPAEKLAPVFTRQFESAEIACTAGPHAAPHGLGLRPLLLTLRLRCKTADWGYAVGDEIDVNGAIRDEQSGTAVNQYNGTYGADRAHCFVNYTGQLYVRHKAGTGFGTIDNARWRFVFRAFA